MTRRSRTQRRRAIKSLILDRDFDGLFSLASEEPDTATYLVAFVFDRDDLLRWRSIESLGRLSAHMANVDELERVRGIIRRLLWLMNDESGGIAWNGPETIGEILFNTPVLIGEYGRIVASFVSEEPFGTGTLWAIARMALKRPEEFERIEGVLRRSLGSQQSEERGYALLGLSTINPDLAKKDSETLLEDSGVVRMYDFETGDLRSVTVGDIAKEVREPSAKAA